MTWLPLWAHALLWWLCDTSWQAELAMAKVARRRVPEPMTRMVLHGPSGPIYVTHWTEGGGA